MTCSLSLSNLIMAATSSFKLFPELKISLPMKTTVTTIALRAFPTLLIYLVALWPALIVLLAQFVLQVNKPSPFRLVLKVPCATNERPYDTTRLQAPLVPVHARAEIP